MNVSSLHYSARPIESSVSSNTCFLGCVLRVLEILFTPIQELVLGILNEKKLPREDRSLNGRVDVKSPVDSANDNLSAGDRKICAELFKIIDQNPQCVNFMNHHEFLENYEGLSEHVKGFFREYLGHFSRFFIAKPIYTKAFFKAMLSQGQIKSARTPSELPFEVQGAYTQSSKRTRRTPSFSEYLDLLCLKSLPRTVNRNLI